MFFSIMSGYAFGTMQFKGEQVLFYVFLLGIMVPTEAIIVPLFFDLRSAGLTNTHLGRRAAADRPVGRVRHLLDADVLPQSPTSRSPRPRGIDGAGNHRILWSVLVPTARPAIVTLVLLTFMWTWNEFLIPLVMSPRRRGADRPPRAGVSSRVSTCRAPPCSPPPP